MDMTVFDEPGSFYICTETSPRCYIIQKVSAKHVDQIVSDLKHDNQNQTNTTTNNNNNNTNTQQKDKQNKRNEDSTNRSRPAAAPVAQAAPAVDTPPPLPCLPYWFTPEAEAELATTGAAFEPTFDPSTNNNNTMHFPNLNSQQPPAFVPATVASAAFSPEYLNGAEPPTVMLSPSDCVMYAEPLEVQVSQHNMHMPGTSHNAGPYLSYELPPNTKYVVLTQAAVNANRVYMDNVHVKHYEYANQPHNWHDQALPLTIDTYSYNDHVQSYNTQVDTYSYNDQVQSYNTQVDTYSYNDHVQSYNTQDDTYSYNDQVQSYNTQDDTYSYNDQVQSYNTQDDTYSYNDQVQSYNTQVDSYNNQVQVQVWFEKECDEYKDTGQAFCYTNEDDYDYCEEMTIVDGGYEQYDQYFDRPATSHRAHHSANHYVNGMGPMSASSSASWPQQQTQAQTQQERNGTTYYRTQQNNTNVHSTNTNDTHTQTPEQILKRLRDQLEYYFSPENLRNDRYLWTQMDNDQFVPIKILATFPRIMNLGGDALLIKKAIQESEVLQLDEKGERVRRPCKRSTIILREIADEHEVEEVTALFTNAKCPLPITIEYSLNNSWYITFGSDEDAQKALVYLYTDVKTHNDKQICARIKTSKAPAAPATTAPTAITPADSPNTAIGQNRSMAPPSSLPGLSPLDNTHTPLITPSDTHSQQYDMQYCVYPWTPSPHQAPPSVYGTPTGAPAVWLPTGPPPPHPNFDLGPHLDQAGFQLAGVYRPSGPQQGSVVQMVPPSVMQHSALLQTGDADECYVYNQQPYYVEMDGMMDAGFSHSSRPRYNGNGNYSNSHRGGRGGASTRGGGNGKYARNQQQHHVGADPATSSAVTSQREAAPQNTANRARTPTNGPAASAGGKAAPNASAVSPKSPSGGGGYRQNNNMSNGGFEATSFNRFNGGNRSFNTGYAGVPRGRARGGTYRGRGSRGTYYNSHYNNNYDRPNSYGSRYRHANQYQNSNGEADSYVPNTTYGHARYAPAAHTIAVPTQSQPIVVNGPVHGAQGDNVRLEGHQQSNYERKHVAIRSAGLNIRMPSHDRHKKDDDKNENSDSESYAESDQFDTTDTKAFPSLVIENSHLPEDESSAKEKMDSKSDDTNKENKSEKTEPSTGKGSTQPTAADVVSGRLSVSEGAQTNRKVSESQHSMGSSTVQSAGSKTPSSDQGRVSYAAMANKQTATPSPICASSSASVKSVASGESQTQTPTNTKPALTNGVVPKAKSSTTSQQSVTSGGYAAAVCNKH